MEKDKETEKLVTIFIISIKTAEQKQK